MGKGKMTPPSKWPFEKLVVIDVITKIKGRGKERNKERQNGGREKMIVSKD